eukprot:493575-Pyramimonas_sp.AAC.1
MVQNTAHPKNDLLGNLKGLNELGHHKVLRGGSTEPQRWQRVKARKSLGHEEIRFDKIVMPAIRGACPNPMR